MLPYKNFYNPTVLFSYGENNFSWIRYWLLSAYYVHKTTVNSLAFVNFFFSFRDKTNRVTTGETPSMWSDQIFFLSTLSEITIWTPCGKRHIFFQLISKPSTRHLYCWTSITCVCCIWLQKKVYPQFFSGSAQFPIASVALLLKRYLNR